MSNGLKGPEVSDTTPGYSRLRHSFKKTNAHIYIHMKTRFSLKHKLSMNKNPLTNNKFHEKIGAGLHLTSSMLRIICEYISIDKDGSLSQHQELGLKS